MFEKHIDIFTILEQNRKKWSRLAVDYALIFEQFLGVECDYSRNQYIFFHIFAQNQKYSRKTHRYFQRKVGTCKNIFTTFEQNCKKMSHLAVDY